MGLGSCSGKLYSYSEYVVLDDRKYSIIVRILEKKFIIFIFERFRLAGNISKYSNKITFFNIGY